MKRILLLVVLFTSLYSNSQTVFYTQDFEVSQTGYTNTPNQTPDADPGDQYFSNAVATNTSIYESGSQLYTNVTNSSLFVGSAPNVINSGNPGILLLDPISVSNATDVEILADFGAVPNDWDDVDGLFMEYNFDGGPWQPLLEFSHSNGSNDPLVLQVNNGVGTTDSATGLVLTFNLQTVKATLGSTGSILNVRIICDSGNNYEAFGVDNIIVRGTPVGGNPAPGIANVSVSPNTPTSSDNVTISADVTDDDGIDSVVLNWGTSSGSLGNSIAMTVLSGDTYTADIPAQANGTEVFFEIVATDDNASPEITTTIEASYQVFDPEPQGFGVPNTDVRYTIDFGNTVANVNNGSFDGSGLAQLPSAGQLDSNTFSFDGFSEGDTDFDADYTSGDYARGQTTGGVSGGGLYAFDLGGGNTALGIQPTGSDFTPGTVYFKFRNDTGETITNISVAYDAYFLNNENRTNSLILAHGPSKTNLTSVTDSFIETGIGQDAVEEWERNFVTADITGLSILDGETYLIAWESNDSGSGSSDELAIDNIQLVVNPTSESPRLFGDVNSLTVLGDVIVSSSSSVKEFVNLVDGVVSTNDNLSLSSSDGASAYVAEVTNGSLNGDLIVEQFFPARRVFRFVSSPVNMTSSVFDQWQQSGLNPGDAGYQDNVGTQITGGMVSNGFDQSPTNNPSIFNFDNLPSQTWNAEAATNNLNLNAGDPLRLFIRGDRSVDLTSATQTATDTKLITKGSLQTGDVVKSFSNTLSNGEFLFVGNPYPSQVDFNLVLQDGGTTDINAANYYAWDPTVQTNGAYVSYDFGLGINTVAGSQVDENLQPTQAVFVEVSDDSTTPFDPQITFKESHKIASNQTNAVYRSSSMDYFRVNLSPITNGATIAAVDGTIAKFSNPTSSTMTKFMNLNESIWIEDNNENYSINSYGLPFDGMEIPLNLSGLINAQYELSLDLQLTGTNLQVVLEDAYTNTEKVLTASDNTYVFSQDPATTSSFTNRFTIKFTTVTLGQGDIDFAKAVTMYPNPISNGDVLKMNGLNPSSSYSWSVTDLRGRVLTANIQKGSEIMNDGLLITNLKSGVYLVQLESNGSLATQKIVVE
ncbi:T9SS type A sorting domain-containing protein [Nonlabens sp. SY33080]|uniref:T9SS type A sorting domain-containing protein n=1 Tax=Nonlabens sp. SY33080 TaxID=2719911 RepID=UPI001428AFD1|nr:T9SS type A sorting domain-containing protein [Nonlabens sp. SY33080]